MKVYTAVEEPEVAGDEIVCFLAGGITNCWDWQSAVIDELSKFDDTDKLVVFSPRRENFPIDDPNAAQEQINWEFNYLHMADIFSMYFASSESVQPICMYELGVHLTRFDLDDFPLECVVSVEEGYKRKDDVIIQAVLALDGENIVNTDATPESHAQLIYEAYLEILNDDEEEQQNIWL